MVNRTSKPQAVSFINDDIRDQSLKRGSRRSKEEDAASNRGKWHLFEKLNLYSV